MKKTFDCAVNHSTAQLASSFDLTYGLKHNKTKELNVILIQMRSKTWHLKRGRDELEQQGTKRTFSTTNVCKPGLLSILKSSFQTQALTHSTHVFQTWFQYAFFPSWDCPSELEIVKKAHRHEIYMNIWKFYPPERFGNKDLVLQTKLSIRCLKASIYQSAGSKTRQILDFGLNPVQCKQNLSVL